VQGSWISFGTSQHSNNWYSHFDGHNQVLWSDDLSLDDDVLAYAFTVALCYWWGSWRYEIFETDIVFNTRHTWTTEEYPSPGARAIEPVAMHELGHALGLNHENHRLATMNSNYPNGAPLGHQNRWRLHADDQQGARTIYPDTSTHRDLTTSKYEKNISGPVNLIDGPSYCNQPFLNCTAGMSVAFEFTFENLGTQTEVFDIGFYLSRDSHITKADIPLGVSYGAWGEPGFSGTFEKVVTFPSYLPTGDYYLGYILDINNAVPESEEPVNFNQSNFPASFSPTTYFRNNFMAFPSPLRVVNNSAVPDQYHVTSEVTWGDIKVDTFGWSPTELFLLSGNIAGSSPLPLTGCGPGVDIMNPTIQPITPLGQTTVIPPATNNPSVSIEFTPPNIGIFLFPYPNPPEFIQVLAKAPNGCWVKSRRRAYRYAFEQ